jgi:hypothetical protein
MEAGVASSFSEPSPCGGRYLHASVHFRPPAPDLGRKPGLKPGFHLFGVMSRDGLWWQRRVHRLA